MPISYLSRRALLGYAPALTAAAAVAPSLLAAQPEAKATPQMPFPEITGRANVLGSIKSGFLFLDFMMDAYATSVSRIGLPLPFHTCLSKVSRR